MFLQEGDFTGFQTDGRWALRSGHDVPQSNVFTFFFLASLIKGQVYTSVMSSNVLFCFVLLKTIKCWKVYSRIILELI